jgi:hypothetical protein
MTATIFINFLQRIVASINTSDGEEGGGLEVFTH